MGVGDIFGKLGGKTAENGGYTMEGILSAEGTGALEDEGALGD